MRKRIQLAGGVEEGWRWYLLMAITPKEVIQSAYFNVVENDKTKIRIKDNLWVARHIPSAIAWKIQVHHNWKDGGRMYLLSPEEHRARDKK